MERKFLFAEQIKNEEQVDESILQKPLNIEDIPKQQNQNESENKIQIEVDNFYYTQLDEYGKIINDNIRAILPQLLEKYIVLHLCGKGRQEASHLRLRL